MAALIQLLDTPLVHRLGWTLLHFLWQGVFVGLTAAFAILLTRRWSARAIYCILLGCFVVLVLVPLVTFPLVSLKPADLERSLAVLAADPSASSTPRANLSGTVRESFASELSPAMNDEAGMSVDAAPQLRDSATAEHLVSSSARSRNEYSLDQRVVGLLESSLAWIVGLWCVGVVLLTTRLTGSWWRLRRTILTNVRPLSGSWLEMAKRLTRRLGVRRAVKFLESGAAQVPAVVGWFKPIVLVPTSVLTNMTPVEIESLLIHELAHIRRYDAVVNMFQTVAETLLFYHPVVWWLSARLRRERENCCDDIAVRIVGDRVVYSKALVAAAEMAIEPPSTLAVASDGGELIDRVRRLLDRQEYSVGRPSRFGLLAVSTCILFAMIAALACSKGAIDGTTSNRTDVDVAKPVESQVREFLNSEERLDRITGRVVNSTGRPVGGVRVLLRERPKGNEVRESMLGNDGTSDVAEMITDDEGRFAFVDVPSAGFGRVVYREKPVAYDLVALPGDIEELAAVWKHVVDGDTVELKAGKAASLNGQITDIDGQPLADATVTVRFFMSIRHITQADLEDLRWPASDDSQFLSLKESQRSISVNTDSQGRFSITNLPKESGVILEVSHGEYVGDFFYAATVEQLDDETRKRMKRQVQTDPVKGLLDPGHHIKVKVVYGDTEEIAKGAITSEFVFRGQRRERTVHPDGTFELSHVPHGQFYLFVEPPEEAHDPKFSQYVRAGKILELNPDKREHQVTIRLQTPEDSDSDKEIQRFLRRIDNVLPDFPPRKPRYFVRSSEGEILELRLKEKTLEKGDFPLIAHLKSLEKLDLQRTNVADDDLRHLAGMPNLRELSLSWNRPIGSGIAQLKDLPQLQTLNLRLTSVGDDDLAFLKNLPKLRHLDLDGTRITDDGLKQIGQLKQLETLMLGDLKITDDGLRHLMGLKNLRGLTLNETNVTQTGLEYLATSPRFAWMASFEGTAKEYIRRAEQGEFETIDAMCAAGVFLPKRGKYKLLKLDAVPRTERDENRNAQRFELEMHWVLGDGRPDEVVFFRFEVDRGAVFGHEVGLRQD